LRGPYRIGDARRRRRGTALSHVPSVAGDLSRPRRVEPRWIDVVDRVVANVGVEVEAVAVADGVGRQEPAEGGVVGAGGEDRELGLVVAALAGVTVDDARARRLAERAVGVGVADGAGVCAWSRRPHHQVGAKPSDRCVLTAREWLPWSRGCRRRHRCR
jgi:hypothetical protein